MGAIISIKTKKGLVTKIILQFMAALFTMTMLYSNGFCGSPPPEISLVKKALVRRMCMEYYWLGGWVQPGTTIPIKVKFQDDKFYVWADDQHRLKDARVSGYYWGRLKDNDTAVTMREAFASDLKEGSQISPLHKKRKRFFETGELYNDHLKLPSGCSPQYDPPSPGKDEMISNIIDTLKKALTLESKAGSETPNQQGMVTLIIADFNIDYPSTFVLVEPSQKLFVVALQDSENPNSFGNVKKKYALNAIADDEKPLDLIMKIRKHGLIKKIILD